jgi:glutathione S-transferase
MAPNPRRVRIFMDHKGIGGVEVVQVDINRGEHRLPAHKDRFGVAHVPALELDDGRVLTESRAICSYLEALHPEPNLMGHDAFERAEIEMWDRRAELMQLMPTAMWVRHAHLGLATLENVQVPQIAAQGEQGTRAAAAWFARRLDASSFVAGKRFTIADITLFCALDFARVVKFRAADEHPSIARWRDRLKSMAGFGG